MLVSIMQALILELSELSECCLLPQLKKNYEECETHPEYDIWKLRLEKYFYTLLEKIEHINLLNSLNLSSGVVSSLLILYHELQSDGPWNTETNKKYSNKLDYHFELLYGITLNSILQEDSVFNRQEVFDNCFEKIHLKLTSADFKKYPGLIEVYNFMSQNVKDYAVKLNPLTSLPVSLLLIDDYVPSNKIKGLKCCKSILQCLTPEDFNGGNYYDVIHKCLNKVFVDRDIEITNLVNSCFLELLRLIPSHVKLNITDVLYSKALEQLDTESNLYRKAALLSFVTHLISIQGVNCARKKNTFMSIICDNVVVCCNEAVSEILLCNVLKCLEEWVKHCWCTWQLHADQKLVSLLLNLLYASKDEEMINQIISLVITLLSLCSSEERSKILISLEMLDQISNEQFQQRIQTIKQDIKHEK